MNIYRIYPGNDAFEINGAYLPYIDVIADTIEQAREAAFKIIPDLNQDDWGNCGLQGGAMPELIGKH